MSILTEEELVKRKVDRSENLLHLYQSMLERLERKLKRSFSEVCFRGVIVLTGGARRRACAHKSHSDGLMVSVCCEFGLGCRW